MLPFGFDFDLDLPGSLGDLAGRSGRPAGARRPSLGRPVYEGRSVLQF